MLKKKGDICSIFSIIFFSKIGNIRINYFGLTTIGSPPSLLLISFVAVAFVSTSSAVQEFKNNANANAKNNFDNVVLVFIILKLRFKKRVKLSGFNVAMFFIEKKGSLFKFLMSFPTLKIAISFMIFFLIA
jgi:hypothetical protein